MKYETLTGIVGSARRQRPGFSMPDRCVGEHKIEVCADVIDANWVFPVPEPVR